MPTAGGAHGVQKRALDVLTMELPCRFIVEVEPGPSTRATSALNPLSHLSSPSNSSFCVFSLCFSDRISLWCPGGLEY